MEGQFKEQTIKNLMSSSQLNNQTTLAGFIASSAIGLVGLNLIPEEYKQLAVAIAVVANSYQAYRTNQPSREQVILMNERKNQ